MLVLVFDGFKRYLSQCQFSQKRRKNCLQIWTFHSEVTAWKRSRYVLKYFEKYPNVYVMYHVPFPWMPLILYYLWFLPSMMEPIKMRHHLNITIPNGSWSICSTIRCIFLAVVLQALLVMRSDEVEGGLPISSTSRSGALARLKVGNSAHFFSHQWTSQRTVNRQSFESYETVKNLWTVIRKSFDSNAT